MPIGIKISKVTGLPICPCCRLGLYHCNKCWVKFHNSHNGEDYMMPEYFGQPFYSEETVEKVNKMLNRKSKVKPDKSRKYVEGDYDLHENLSTEHLNTLNNLN